MDALSLIPVQHEHYCQSSQWIGTLAASLGEAMLFLDQKNAAGARRFLRSTLAEFIDSPVPGEELKEDLRERYLR